MTLCDVALAQPRLRYPNLSHKTWTSAQFQDLKDWHSEGLSATLIAIRLNEKYGTSYTRNAVIGASHRANLPKRPSKILSPDHGVRKDKRRRNPGAGVVQSVQRRAITGSRALPKPTIAQVPFLGVTLMQLEPNQCHFPRGGEKENDPILFCGQPVKEDSSYCPWCHSITHVQP